MPRLAVGLSRLPALRLPTGTVRTVLSTRRLSLFPRCGRVWAHGNDQCFFFFKANCTQRFLPQIPTAFLLFGFVTSRYLLLSAVPHGYRIKQDQTAAYGPLAGTSREQLDGPLLPTLAELLIRWQGSQRDGARGPAGAPRGVLMGWAQRFLCHQPLAAKRSSFEIN